MSLSSANENIAPAFGSSREIDAERYLELNYRVANSLQLVSSFLSLQEREALDPLAKQALRTAASRVAAVGRVQRAVLGGRNPTMDLRPFLHSLCADLAVLTGLAIDVDADTIVAPAAAAEHIGVVVNELVLDAARHDSQRRVIKVVCHRRRRGDTVMLTVTDNGPRPVECFEERAQGVGMIILRAAAGLLNGRLTFGNAKGARATLAFRVTDAPRQTRAS